MRSAFQPYFKKRERQPCTACVAGVYVFRVAFVKVSLVAFLRARVAPAMLSIVLLN